MIGPASRRPIGGSRRIRRYFSTDPCPPAGLGPVLDDRGHDRARSPRVPPTRRRPRRDGRARTRVGNRPRRGRPAAPRARPRRARPGDHAGRRRLRATHGSPTTSASTRSVRSGSSGRSRSPTCRPRSSLGAQQDARRRRALGRPQLRGLLDDDRPRRRPPAAERDRRRQPAGTVDDRRRRAPDRRRGGARGRAGSRSRPDRAPPSALGGLALGGGVGFASRAFGTTSDNIVSLGIVTADGRYRLCDAKQNPDLYWACRGGGGGNFGIVTHFTLPHPSGSAPSPTSSPTGTGRRRPLP